MKMKTEDARKKLQDGRYVGWLGWAGSIERRSCLLSSVVVHEFWPWLQCAPNWLGSHSCWWRHYVVMVKLLMRHWFPLVASCLGSRRLVWPVYLPYQPTVCSKAALEGCGNWNPYCWLKSRTGWFGTVFCGLNYIVFIQEWSYKRILSCS